MFDQSYSILDITYLNELVASVIFARSLYTLCPGDYMHRYTKSIRSSAPQF